MDNSRPDITHLGKDALLAVVKIAMERSSSLIHGFRLDGEAIALFTTNGSSSCNE